MKIMEKITKGAEVIALSFDEAVKLFQNGAEIMEKLENFQKFGNSNTPEFRKAYWDMKEETVKANPNYVAGFNLAKQAKEEYAALYLDTLQQVEEAEKAEAIVDPITTVENKTDEIVLDTVKKEADDSEEENEEEGQFYLAEITDELNNDPSNLMANIGLVLQLASHAEIADIKMLPADLKIQLAKTRARLTAKA